MRRFSYFPILLVLVLVSVFLDLYVFQGVKVLTFVVGTDARLIIHTAFWFVSSVVLATLIIGLYKSIPTRKVSKFFKGVINGFITLFVTKLAFALVLFAEDIFRLLAGMVSVYPERFTSISVVALLLSAIPFFSFIFGVTHGKYHYKVRRTVLYLNDLPESFEGFTITQISDIHAGSFDSEAGVKKGIDLINAQQSDLFVFTGDLVNNQASEIEPWIPLFKQIEAPYGKFSILGNHDYGDYIQWNSAEEKIENLNRLKDNHKQLGFNLLLDEHALIDRSGQSITLLGVENWGIGFGQRGNLNKALQGVDTQSLKILLSHDPSHWDAEVKNHPSNIHLTLSGHTHGMQFGIEIFGFKWSPVKFRYPNWAGLAKQNGRYLYVNRGFGFLGFAGRVGIWPEITVIELRRS